MPARFVLSKAKNGKFSFALVATNGNVIVKSASYETKRSALSAIRTVQRGAAAPVDDQTVAPAEATPTRRRASKPAAKRTTTTAARARRSAKSTEDAAATPRTRTARTRNGTARAAGTRATGGRSGSRTRRTRTAP